jgi:uncharacterized protein (DUF1684 family)
METPEPVKSLGICVLYHKETYKGKRYIDAEILSGFKIVLDFNMAYYPSYAYNEKFVCVLPPRGNMPESEIRVSERNSK